MVGGRDVDNRLPGTGTFGERLMAMTEDSAVDTTNELAEVVLRMSVHDAPIGPPLRVSAGRPGAGRFRKAVSGDHPPDTLRRSGQIEQKASLAHLAGANLAEAMVSFGAIGTGAEQYAAWQHEHVMAKHPRGGKAKYLEDNLKAITVIMGASYAARLAAKLESL